MTILEKKSKRKAIAIRNLVDSGEYSPSYALMIAEELNDSGKLLDVDYEPLAEYLEELLNKEEIHKEVTDNEETSDDVVPYEMVNEEDKTLSDEPLF